MLNRCNVCGLSKEKCCCSFSPSENQLKEEIKSIYLDSADRFASKKGMANFIWRQLINAKNSESKAWSEKQSAIANMATRYSNKYDPIIEQKDKEIDYQNKLIKKLQGMLGASEPVKDKPLNNDALACKGCGSTTGCYCK